MTMSEVTPAAPAQWRRGQPLKAPQLAAEKLGKARWIQCGLGWILSRAPSGGRGGSGRGRTDSGDAIIWAPSSLGWAESPWAWHETRVTPQGRQHYGKIGQTDSFPRVIFAL